MWTLAVVVVNPFSIGRAHWITIKGAGGELLRVRTVGIDSPDTNAVCAAMETPGENQVAISATLQIQNPRVGIGEQRGGLPTIRVHASHALSVGDEQFPVGCPSGGVYILG